MFTYTDSITSVSKSDKWIFSLHKMEKKIRIYCITKKTLLTVWVKLSLESKVSKSDKNKLHSLLLDVSCESARDADVIYFYSRKKHIIDTVFSGV